MHAFVRASARGMAGSGVRLLQMGRMLTSARQASEEASGKVAALQSEREQLAAVLEQARRAACSAA